VKVEIITETLTNLEIAECQIERAIALFFETEDYVSSLTLAGAAEEILGKLLNQEGKPHWLDDIASGSLEVLGYTDEDSDHPEVRKSKKDIANLSNYYKNRLKHFNGDESMTFSVDYYAAEMIDRAISNYWNLNHELTELMELFTNEIIFGNKFT